MHHPVWDLIKRQDAERLSVEDLYDLLISFAEKSSVIKRLTRMEELMATQTDALSRVQADQQKIVDLVTSIKSNLVTLAANQDAANTRMIADLAALRNAAGSGDADALNAIADSMEQNVLTPGQAVVDQLNTMATTESGLDLPPATQAISGSGGSQTVGATGSAPATPPVPTS